MARFRGLTHRNVIGLSFNGPGNMRLRRSIDLRELGDMGSITESASDLPTSGAAHRSANAKSATREHVDLSTVADSVVVDTQDMGSITETASATIGYNDEPYQY